MKKSLRLFFMFVAVVALFAVIGCRSDSTSSSKDTGVPIYAPSDPARVQVLWASPDPPSVRLGEITVVATSNSKTSSVQIKKKLREAAAKMGADAVVIVSDRAGISGGVVTGTSYGRTTQQTSTPVVVGVALKYQ
jgi:hypothetical protein